MQKLFAFQRDTCIAEIADPAGIYLLKVNNRDTRPRCEICSKLTRKTPERRQLRLVSFLLSLNIFHTLF